MAGPAPVCSGPSAAALVASRTLAQIAKAGDSLPTATDLSFLQISDSHIGFSKEANKDVTETFKSRLIASMRCPLRRFHYPHWGYHPAVRNRRSSTRFDQVLKSCKTKDVFMFLASTNVLK